MASGTKDSEQQDVNRDVARENWDRYLYALTRGHSSYVSRARRLEEYYLGGGLQWSATDRANIENAGRPVIEVNQIFPAVNMALGDQLNSRVDISFRPRNNETDQEIADTLTKVAKQVCDDIAYQWLESQMFSDGMIQQRGFIDVFLDFSADARGVIMAENIDPLDVMIDPDANGYDPNTWADVMLIKRMTLDEIRQLFGEEKAAEVEMKVNATTYGTDESEDRNSFADDGERSGFLAAKHWTQGSITRYAVIYRQQVKHELTEVIVTVDGKVEVMERYTPDERSRMIADGGLATKRIVKRIRFSVSTADTVLHDDWSPYRTFTVIPFFPYFRRGRTRGMVDNATSPQDLLNKSTSQLLHIVNTTANSGWMVPEGALVNMRPEDLKDQGAKTGLVMVYRPNLPAPTKILPNPVPPGLDRMSEKAELAIKTITGISDAMQGLNGPEVSGIANRTKLYQGKTQLAGPLDNLARSRNLFGRKLLELMQDFYTEERVFLITDTSDPSQTRYNRLIINQMMPDGVVANHISVGDYDVVIADMPTMATFEDSQFQAALDMRKEGIGIPDSFIVESSPLTRKADIVKAMSQTTNVDPEAEAKAREIEAKVRKLDAETERTKVETVNKAVESQYSAMQAANVIATTPQTAPVADQLLHSAGFVDKDQPPIVAAPVGGQPTPQAALAGIERNTNPLTPANPGVGLERGIETPTNDGALANGAP